MDILKWLSEQTWWGKCLGLFFGHLIAGPLGGVFGLLIGHYFDKGLYNQLHTSYSAFHQERHVQIRTLFLKNTFTTMGAIAKADGRVSEEAIDMALVIMDELRLTAKQKIQAKQWFRDGKEQQSGNFSAILTLRKALAQNRRLLQAFLNIQFRFAQAGGLTHNKIRALNQIFALLGVAPVETQQRFYQEYVYRGQSQGSQQSQQSQHARSSAHAYLQEAYVILGVTPETNEPEVKKAYRRLMSKYHPDKLIAKGMSEAAVQEATQKTQTIRKAYEAILEHRGW
ncbi:MAG: co-chaperone DjlA [Legionellaceae bacterium]|nr:co-chaperone DjlA [Legionellaceae bacterium]